MRHLITFLLLLVTLALHAGQTAPGPWIAYNFEAKIAATVTVATDGTVSCQIPLTGKRSTPALAFLTTTSAGPLGNLTNRTLTATVALTATGAPVFPTYTVNSVTRPVAVRLWLSSSPEPYNFIRVTDSNQASWWWSNPIHVPMNDLLLWGSATLSIPVTAGQWSSALGKTTSDPGWGPCVTNVHQIGFSWGSYYFDTGCKVTAGTGTATFHVLDLRAD
jgi:hypothetical protein